MKLTKHHFGLFKNHCENWKEFFGLSDWRIGYRFEDNAEKDCYGTCARNTQGRIACIYLRPTWDNIDKEDITEQLNRTAFHEIAHVLLADMELIATARYIDSYEFPKAEEACIRRLENCVFENFK